MNQPPYILKNGARIKTSAKLDPMIGMVVPAQCLAMRRVSAEGIIRGVVGGHSGDLYYVEHETHDLNYAVYCLTEFEVIS